MNIAVIPAVLGNSSSNRLSTRKILGKPMIAYSVDVAKATNLFDHIIVYANNNDVANALEDLGVEVLFAPPASSLEGNFETTEIIAQAAQLVLENKLHADALCCISPISPFLTPDSIKAGLKLLETGDWSYSISAVEYKAPIFQALRTKPDGCVEMIFPEHYLTRSQDLPRVFHDAGQFYWGTKNAWLSKTPIFSNKSQFIELPRLRVQDIDTPEDWEIAEKIFTLLSSAK